MIQTKTIAMVLLLVIATVGAIGIVGTGIQSAQAYGFGSWTGNPHEPGTTGNPHPGRGCPGAM